MSGATRSDQASHSGLQGLGSARKQASFEKAAERRGPVTPKNTAQCGLCGKQSKLTRVAQEKAIPFEIRVPNSTTIEAMEEARRGDLHSFDSVSEFMADLNAND